MDGETELDRSAVLARSMAIAGLAIAIAGLYATIVLGLGLAFGRSIDDGPGLVLPVVATAVVAVAFEPLRTGLQRLSNRLVSGRRATPLEVLSQLTAELSDNADRGTDSLARLIAAGTGADVADVWVGDADRLRVHASWPDGNRTAEPRTLRQLEQDPHKVIEPVRRDGRVFGAIGITLAERYSTSADDRRLLTDVAAASGQLLRNLGLNADLEARAREVRHSRRRMVAAQDVERQRLERDLHDGAQQHALALKVKLDLASLMAEREGREAVAGRLRHLSGEAQEAVESLRTVAHGIYPPLLETRGLGPALTSIGTFGNIQLFVDAGTVDRLPRRAEETIYFCAVEMCRAVSAAHGSQLDLGLSEASGRARLRAKADVAADRLLSGALRDRIDAVDGSTTIVRDTRSGHVEIDLPVGEAGRR